jgi:hypothetical protein
MDKSLNNIIRVLGIVLLISFCSCKTAYYSIGMSEDEFLSHNKRVQLTQSSASTTIYQRMVMVSGQWQFFYFRNNYLVEVNYGTYAPDIIIENR